MLPQHWEWVSESVKVEEKVATTSREQWNVNSQAGVNYIISGRKDCSRESNDKQNTGLSCGSIRSDLAR